MLNQGPDRDVNMVMIQAYNDWHVDEWCGAYPDRFIPCGILPMWDAELAAGEIHRLSAKGVHAVTFSENPEALNMPSIHTDFWDPVFTAACDTETVLCSPRGLVVPRRAGVDRRAAERDHGARRGLGARHLRRADLGQRSGSGSRR